MKAVILGGTVFLGIALREELRARGHDVTLFNRGRAASAPAAFRTVRGDRTQGFDGLEDERFDAVIDTSGYEPHVVERSARFFERYAERYVFISSISVYDITRDEIDEDSPKLALPKDASRTTFTNETYGPLKALCELVVASAFRNRATIVRPGLIVGPHDPTDRFTYWPLRFARGGNVLAPGTPERRVQFVDVRDLAAFVVTLLERGAGGDYNVTSPQGRFTMGDVVSACAAVARVPNTVTWIEDEVLVERGIAPWIGLPLWIPPSLGIPGFANTNVRKAVNHGLTIRTLPQTVRDTLRWAMRRPRSHVAKAGISAETEAALLAPP